MAMQTFTYSPSCKLCGKPFAAGESITVSNGSGNLAHQKCYKQYAEGVRAKAAQLIAETNGTEALFPNTEAPAPKAPYVDPGIVLESRFDQSCSLCGRRINRGDEVRLRNRKPECPHGCPPADPKPEPTEAPAVPEELDLGTAKRVMEGTYTLVRTADDYRTIRVHTVDNTGSDMHGKTIFSYLSGSDNDSDYTGFAFLGDDNRVWMWRRFADRADLKRDAEALLDPKSAAEAGYQYALESERCYRCNHKLTVPASIHRGLGPVCSQKVAM